MKKISILIAALTLSISLKPLAAQNKKVFIIDKQTVYQEIDNFSASDAWRCAFIGKNWPQEKKEKIADLLFKREFDEKGNPIGMALTNWRVNIGAGSYENREAKEVDNSWNRTECFLSPDGKYDFTKQAGQQWFMKAARERGMNNFLFFTNSAPYFMTRSASTVSTDQDCINLQNDKFDDFARFLVKSAQHFSEQGFHVNYISPNNEPNGQWHTNSFQEGSFATKADLYRMVEELDKAISEAQIDTKILIPEVGDMKYLFEIDSIAKTPDDIIHSMFYKDGQYSVLKFKNLFNCVAAHDYWSAYPATLLVDIRNRIHKELSANGHNTKFWASEYCILEKNEEITMPASPERSINLGLYVARIIHNDLTLANASAWQWWTAVSLGEDVPIQLLPLEGSNGLSLQYDGEISTTKMLWTTANYSFFVRPGMKRIAIKPTYKISDLEAATSLMISSYTDGKEVVTVAINYLEENQVITLNCDHAQKGKVYLTTIDKNLQYMGEQPLKKLQLPARSVATIVVEDN